MLKLRLDLLLVVMCFLLFEYKTTNLVRISTNKVCIIFFINKYYVDYQMSNFETIKEASKRKGIKMLRLIEVSGMTSAGFYKAGRNDSFSPEVLHKLAAELDIPITSFKGLADSEYLAILSLASFNTISSFNYIASTLFNLKSKQYGRTPEQVAEYIKLYYANGILEKFIPYVNNKETVDAYKKIKKELEKI